MPTPWKINNTDRFSIKYEFILLSVIILGMCVLAYNSYQHYRNTTVSGDIDIERYRGKVIVITGTSSGLGKSMAVLAAKLGMKIVLVDIILPPSERLLDMFSHQGVEAIAVYADLANPQDRARIIDRAMKRFDRIDYLVNNAGYIYWTGVEDIELKQGHHQFEVNFWAYVDLANRVIPIMRQQGGGTILNIGSTSGLRRVHKHRFGLYAASKQALLGITSTLAYELRKENINVKIACPGAMRTNIIANAVRKDMTKGQLLALQNVLNLRYESPDYIAREIFEKMHQKNTLILPGKNAEKYKKFAETGYGLN